MAGHAFAARIAGAFLTGASWCLVGCGGTHAPQYSASQCKILEQPTLQGEGPWSECLIFPDPAALEGDATTFYVELTNAKDPPASTFEFDAESIWFGIPVSAGPREEVQFANANGGQTAVSISDGVSGGATSGTGVLQTDAADFDDGDFELSLSFAQVSLDHEFALTGTLKIHATTQAMDGGN